MAQKSDATTVADPPGGVPEKRLERLFGEPLERFTAARNELAKELRDAGERAGADWLKSLRKPTRAAWLVNQLARRKKEAGRLLAAGEELRDRQEEMLTRSTDADKLRAAVRAEQEAIDALMRTAAALGREHEVSSQTLDRVEETLQAASSDPDVAEAIRLGRLSRERRASSIGLAQRGRPKKKSDVPARRARQRATARRKEAEKKAASAEKKVVSAEKRVERERAGLERAREALEERAERLQQAERELRSARHAQREIKK
jgi:hypothetical protein